MRKYTDKGTLRSVFCNGCGKRMIVDGGILREGAFGVSYAWDFFSEKDGETHRWDLCEACYDRMIREFQIQPEVEEQVEII